MERLPAIQFYEDTLGLLPASREGMWATEGAPPPANPREGVATAPRLPEGGAERLAVGGCGAPGAHGPSCPGTVGQARKAPRGGWTPHQTLGQLLRIGGRATGAGLCLSPEKHGVGVRQDNGHCPFLPSGPRILQERSYESNWSSHSHGPLSAFQKPHSRTTNRLPPRPARRPLWAQPPRPSCLLLSCGGCAGYWKGPLPTSPRHGTPAGPGRLAR